MVNPNLNSCLSMTCEQLSTCCVGTASYSGKEGYTTVKLLKPFAILTLVKGFLTRDEFTEMLEGRKAKNEFGPDAWFARNLNPPLVSLHDCFY